MTNIFTRMKDSISSDLHDMMDKKEQNNPVAALNHYLRKSEQEKERVRKLVDRQYKLKDEFTREYHKAQDLADKREKQAEIAQKAGEEDMYQLDRKSVVEGKRGRVQRGGLSREKYQWGGDRQIH